MNEVYLIENNIEDLKRYLFRYGDILYDSESETHEGMWRYTSIKSHENKTFVNLETLSCYQLYAYENYLVIQLNGKCKEIRHNGFPIIKEGIK